MLSAREALGARAAEIGTIYDNRSGYYASETGVGQISRRDRVTTPARTGSRASAAAADE